MRLIEGEKHIFLIKSSIWIDYLFKIELITIVSSKVNKKVLVVRRECGKKETSARSLHRLVPLKFLSGSPVCGACSCLPALLSFIKQQNLVSILISTPTKIDINLCLIYESGLQGAPTRPKHIWKDFKVKCSLTCIMKCSV